MITLRLNSTLTITKNVMAKLMALWNGSKDVNFVLEVVLRYVAIIANGAVVVHVKAPVAAVATMVALAHPLFGKLNTKERRLQ